jgi:hypothetical protein
MMCPLGNDVIKVISVYFTYGGKLNLLETIGIRRSLDQETTPYMQVKKSYNLK